MIKERFYGEIPESFLILDRNEAAARLKVARDYSNELIESCEARLRRSLKCGYTGVLTDIEYGDDCCMDFGFGPVNSTALYNNLKGAGEAYIFAVTLGYNVDILIEKLSVISIAEHFITDALASAFAESACDYAEKEIKGTAVCGRRFGPGYADLSISVQPQILRLISADKRLNIKCNNSYLLSPSKTITAIMGKKQ